MEKIILASVIILSMLIIGCILYILHKRKKAKYLIAIEFLKSIDNNFPPSFLIAKELKEISIYKDKSSLEYILPLISFEYSEPYSKNENFKIMTDAIQLAAGLGATKDQLVEELLKVHTYTVSVDETDQERAQFQDYLTEAPKIRKEYLLGAEHVRYALNKFCELKINNDEVFYWLAKQYHLFPSEVDEALTILNPTEDQKISFYFKARQFSKLLENPKKIDEHIIDEVILYLSDPAYFKEAEALLSNIEIDKTKLLKGYMKTSEGVAFENAIQKVALVPDKNNPEVIQWLLSILHNSEYYKIAEKALEGFHVSINQYIANCSNFEDHLYNFNFVFNYTIEKIFATDVDKTNKEIIQWLLRMILIETVYLEAYKALDYFKVADKSIVEALLKTKKTTFPLDDENILHFSIIRAGQLAKNDDKKVINWLLGFLDDTKYYWCVDEVLKKFNLKNSKAKFFYAKRNDDPKIWANNIKRTGELVTENDTKIVSWLIDMLQFNESISSSAKMVLYKMELTDDMIMKAYMKIYTDVYGAGDKNAENIMQIAKIKNRDNQVVIIWLLAFLSCDQEYWTSSGEKRYVFKLADEVLRDFKVPHDVLLRAYSNGQNELAFKKVISKL
jgi:hypothetical protein